MKMNAGRRCTDAVTVTYVDAVSAILWPCKILGRALRTLTLTLATLAVPSIARVSSCSAKGVDLDVRANATKERRRAKSSTEDEMKEGNVGCNGCKESLKDVKGSMYRMQNCFLGDEKLLVKRKAMMVENIGASVKYTFC